MHRWWKGIAWVARSSRTSVTDLLEMDIPDYLDLHAALLALARDEQKAIEEATKR